MNLFESLASLNGAQVVVEQVKEGCSLEVHGTIKVSIGIIEAELDYFARTFEVRHLSNVVGVDDWEVHSIRATIGGNPIDDFYKFKNGFSEHGLKSIAELLNFDKVEIIAQSLKLHKMIKLYYGKKLIVWNLLSADEKRDMYKAVKDSGVQLEKYILDTHNLNEEEEEQQ